MKKIAVCLSGIPRNWEKTLQYASKYLFDPLDADVFIHIWNIDDSETDLKAKDIERITYNYCKPVDMEIEYLDLSIAKYFPWLGHRMFYKTWRTDVLRQKHERKYDFKYDVVIKTREELEYIRPLNDMDLEFVDENVIIIPEGFDYYGINDMFALGSSSVMIKYSRMFLDMEFVQFDPEIFVLNHLEKEGLSALRTPHLYKLRGHTTEELGDSILQRKWE